MPSIIERLERRALSDPTLAAWCASWRRHDRLPTLDDALLMIELYAEAFDVCRAELLRAKQLQPVQLTMICESPECSALRALKRRKPAPGDVVPGKAGGSAPAAGGD